MSLRDKNFVSGEYYHIYNRGNGKHDIFLDEEDYNRFIKLLYICNSNLNFKFSHSVVGQNINAFDLYRETPIVDILSWVVMPNHFHIILTFKESSILKENYNPISEFMRKLSTAYVMYFNKKYNRTGGLFEGKFKSKYIDKENYFQYIFSYIHLNPVKLIQPDWKEKGIKNKKVAKEFLRNYKYSSLIDFIGIKRHENKIINKQVIPSYIFTGLTCEIEKSVV
jgi:putative transposase